MPRQLSKKLKGVIVSWDRSCGLVEMEDRTRVGFHWASVYGYESDAPIRIGDLAFIDSDGIGEKGVLYEAMIIKHPDGCKCEFHLFLNEKQRGAKQR